MQLKGIHRSFLKWKGSRADMHSGPLGEVRNWKKFSFMSACRTWINKQVFFNCYSFYNSIKLNYEEGERQAEAMLT